MVSHLFYEKVICSILSITYKNLSNSTRYRVAWLNLFLEITTYFVLFPRKLS